MKEKHLMPKITWLILGFTAIVAIQSCKSKNKNKDEKINVTEQANLAPPKPNIALPIYEQTWKEFKKYFGASLKNPQKFIIRIEFNDFNTPSLKNSKLLLYPAQDQQDYGKEQEPLEIPSTSAKVEIGSALVIGNNEFDANKKLLMTPGDFNSLKAFDIIQFTPILSEQADGKRNHLSFKVSLIKPDKSIDDLGETKPSPPAPPEY